MRILDKDELDEQRKNYIRYVGALNKLAAGVGDGSRKGEEVRDMALILQTRFLTFILSELVHMSEMLRGMENQTEVDFDDVFESQIEDEEAEEELLTTVPIDSEVDVPVSTKEELADYTPSWLREIVSNEEISEEPLEPTNGEQDDEEISEEPLEPTNEEQDDVDLAEQITGESGDESDEPLGTTAKLLSALEDIESEIRATAHGIVDDTDTEEDEAEDDEE
jgi:hypothetical protein